MTTEIKEATENAEQRTENKEETANADTRRNSNYESTSERTSEEDRKRSRISEELGEAKSGLRKNRPSERQYRFDDEVNQNNGNEFDSDGNPIYEVEKRLGEPTDFKALQQRRTAADKRYGLNKKQSSALTSYVTGLAYFVNKRLLEGNVSERDIACIQNIIEATQKFPVYKGRTYRNLIFKNEQEWSTAEIGLLLLCYTKNPLVKRRFMLYKLFLIRKQKRCI